MESKPESEPEIINLHFTLYGEGITNIITQLRHEGNIKKALELVGCFPDLTGEQAVNLTLGKGKLVGWTGDNTMHYEDIPESEWEENKKIEEKVKAKPIIETNFNYDNAWISPDGMFIGCGMYGHRSKSSEIVDWYGLKSSINDEATLEKSGFLKLSNSILFSHYCIEYEYSNVKITQQQANTLMDFVNENHQFTFHGIHYDKTNFHQFFAMIDVISLTEHYN